MGKITDYEQLIELAGDEILLVETKNGTRTMTYNQLVELIQNQYKLLVGTDVHDAIVTIINSGELNLTDLGMGAADAIPYDDSKSNLGALSVQQAIENLANNGGTGIDDENLSVESTWSSKKISGEIDDIKKSVSDGKSLVASAITDKGVKTAADATFENMADNISRIATRKIDTYIPSITLGGALGIIDMYKEV
jgi:hypothetical protein